MLAVSSAGMLVERELWEDLGGFDPALALLREDVDFGWRVNKSGRVVLCVPAARLRHVRAVAKQYRGADVRQQGLPASALALDRANGLRTFLVNCSSLSFVLGLPRLAALCLLRALGFLALRRIHDARAELHALRYLLGGAAGLRAARAQRATTSRPGSVRGLFTSRYTRLRNAVRRGAVTLVRRRAEAEAALGRVPADLSLVWAEPAEPVVRKPIGPDALPAGALGRSVGRATGLRRPSAAVAVSLTVPEAEQPTGLRPSPRPRPSPVPRDGDRTPPPDLVLVDVSRGQVLRAVLLAPPLLITVGLVLLALIVNWNRLGLDLAGGRLLPIGDLGSVWSEYLAAWHPVGGGTAAPAPAALAVLGGLGGLLAPVGGTNAAVALLLLFDLPLAGVLAYTATRRLAVRRWIRALAAVAYALLPPATAAVAQGRLDAVVVHIMLPPVVAGISSLLTRGRGVTGSTAWLSVAAGSAFGVAVIGAFSPLVHLLLVLVALAGFVVVPGYRGDTRRRVAALFALVLMPLALLLPWPAVVIQHPGVVLHGVGAQVAEQSVSVFDLAALNPGGPGTWPLLGLVVVLALVVGAVLRPHRAALPGLGLTALGIAAVVLVRTMPAAPLAGGPATRGWAGPALLVVGWGLLWALLGLCCSGRRGVLPSLAADPARMRLVVRAAAAAGVVGLLALALGALVPGRSGPLADDGGVTLATTEARETAETGRAVLVLGRDGELTRLSTGRESAFGDDDLAPVPTAPVRLDGVRGGLLSGDRESVRNALAAATASGVLFVVLPTEQDAERVRVVAAELVADAPPTSDGRPVLRMQLTAGQAVLLAPDLAKLAVTGVAPPTTLDNGGIRPIQAAPPSVAVRVSDGPDGRLLVLAAEEEPGWQASVNGKQVPIVRAWGHLVGVAVPTRAADVRIEQPGELRAVLLLIQAAIVLFALLTAIPGRKAQSPSMTSGSRPR